MTNKEARLLIFFALKTSTSLSLCKHFRAPPESFLCPFNPSPVEKEGVLYKAKKDKRFLSDDLIQLFIP